MQGVLEIIGGFVFWYPYLMSMVWIAGTLIFTRSREKNTTLDKHEYEWPAISILVPCYNEEDTIEETIKYLSQLSYPKFEIVVVNDGSQDRTGEFIRGLVDEYSKLRIIDC